MSTSPYIDLDYAVRRAGGRVPLVWARSTAAGASNFGDAASAVVVAAMAGRTPLAQNFNDLSTRLVAVGTIGQNLHWGTVHLWGTGVDATQRAFGNRAADFAAAPDTRYVVHATRGPHSRRTLLDAGLFAPPIYGDGAWFLPRIIPATVPKRYELGVIPHLSELETPQLDARPKSIRYLGSEGDGVRLISTRHEPTWAGWKGKLAEILSCRRIVSVSLHGKLVADAYGIPSLHLALHPGGAQMLDLGNWQGVVDHRFADFYAGAGLKHLPSYCQPPGERTAWDDVIAAVDRLWEPVEHKGAETFFEAFPLTPRVAWADKVWPLDESLMSAIPW